MGRVECSSPPPPTSSSPTETDAGHYKRSKRKRPYDSNKDSSKEPAAKEPAAKRARTSQSPGEPTDAEAGPWTSRNQSTNESTPLQMLGPRRVRRSALIGRRAEQEEEVADGEESGSESLPPERRALWPGLSPDPNYVPPPDRTNSLGYLTHLSVMETVRALAEEPPSPEPSPDPWDLLSDTDESTEAHRPRRPRGPLASPSPSPPPGLLPALQQEQLALQRPVLQQYSQSSSAESTDQDKEETLTASAANSAGASLLPRHQPSTLPEIASRQSTSLPVPLQLRQGRQQ
ncbi:uncharacterized protein TrAtP1_001929 [Trichoderma atroviride]|uniref:uncharacterized protein n=1 Tax=Hypocrea atroviridis TaxID=63577 RepID=UPI00331A4393|nr:hypothetical protein TrAtP1_001929 [Trichoderma atroviride]